MINDIDYIPSSKLYATYLSNKDAQIILGENCDHHRFLLINPPFFRITPFSYGPLSVTRVYNTIYRVYNPIYSKLFHHL